MVILKTNDFKKVNRHLSIIISIRIGELNLSKHQLYELTCLYYDYLIREITINKLSENEFTIRSYNILSNAEVIFIKEDFEYNTYDEYDYYNNMLCLLKELVSKEETIINYLNTVSQLYGIIFRTYRDIKKAHDILNIFKYGIDIERTKLLNCKDNVEPMDFLQAYVDYAISDFRTDIRTIITRLDITVKQRLISICEQRRRVPFKYAQEAI